MQVNGAKEEYPALNRIRELRELLAHGMAAGIGVGHSLGITLESVEKGRTVYTLTPSPATANAIYTVHGGVLATLMDTAMGSAIFTELADGVLYTTLELKVNFIRPVKLDGDQLTCEGRTINIGKRTALAEARVLDPAGRLIAHGTSTCMLIRPTDAT
ncbi:MULTISPECIES: PaaI family thioesterase [unclassified Frankia]|uniref:PaaI family thioesterase n=2 Tax=Frankia TaxID=1854 RepID=UPI002AD2FC40|nr:MULTISPECIES: PaaI family thioesterase [unclassified Frankia]